MPSPPVARATTQKSRWCFTYHNYDRGVNYKHYFRNDNFNIKRIVWGYEQTGDNQIPHLQGYCEFNRSVRLAFVRRILDTAHWEGAIGSATANYLYCTKSQNFDSIGNFSKEAACGAESTKLHVTEIIKGLLNGKTSLQTMLSKEYASQHIYYDKIIRKIKEVRSMRELFLEWSQKRLRVWQYVVLKRVLTQGDRIVTWIYDERGNNGKSFLANYLSILYDFQLLDGQISCRDLAGVLNVNASGISLDVCRAAAHSLDYGAIECLKNGYLTSGKYAGKCLRFKPMKLVVFSNFYPDRSKLSQDRWDVLTVGEGPLENLDEDSVITPSQQHPFIEPPPDCDLSCSFNLRQFLIEHGVIEADRLVTATNESQTQVTISQSLSEDAGKYYFSNDQIYYFTLNHNCCQNAKRF